MRKVRIAHADETSNLEGGQKNPSLWRNGLALPWLEPGETPAVLVLLWTFDQRLNYPEHGTPARWIPGGVAQAIVSADIKTGTLPVRNSVFCNKILCIDEDCCLGADPIPREEDLEQDQRQHILGMSQCSISNDNKHLPHHGCRDA